MNTSKKQTGLAGLVPIVSRRGISDENNGRHCHPQRGEGDPGVGFCQPCLERKGLERPVFKVVAGTPMCRPCFSGDGSPEEKADPSRRAEARQHYKMNREEIAATRRLYYAQNREKIRARQRRYYAQNREKLKELGRRWRERHPEKVAEYRRRYREQNPGKVAEERRLYYAKNREKRVDYQLRYRKRNQRAL